MIDRGNVARAKPAPDLFLACQEALGVEVGDCYVVGDAVWDLLAARRARMLSIGLLSGGYGADELSPRARTASTRTPRSCANRSTSSASSSGFRYAAVSRFSRSSCAGR